MKKNIAIYISSLISLIYLVINFLLPADKATLSKYSISVATDHFLDVTILLPQVFIWILALIGYLYISKYAKSIAKSKDGRAFDAIKKGLTVFAFGLPSSGVVSASFKWVAYYHDGFKTTSVVITNYLSLIVALAAFTFIAEGVHLLMTHAKIDIDNRIERAVILVLIIIGVTYTFLVFHDKSKLLSVGSVPNPYYLPSWAILFTLVIPYIYMWAIGLLATVQIATYRFKVRGIVYRQALSRLTLGIGIVLLSYVILQYLTSITGKILNLHIGLILFIVYCFLALLGVGYLLIALGARSMQKIEDV